MYRNIKDWVTMDERGIEVHFVKEALRGVRLRRVLARGPDQEGRAGERCDVAS